jgi:hypothetical protein
LALATCCDEAHALVLGNLVSFNNSGAWFQDDRAGAVKAVTNSGAETGWHEHHRALLSRHGLAARDGKKYGRNRSPPNLALRSYSFVHGVTPVRLMSMGAIRRRIRFACVLLAGIAIGIVMDRTVRRPKPGALPDEFSPHAAGLDRPIEKLSFTNTPVKQALDEIRQKASLKMIIESQALEDAGVRLDTPVTLECNGVTASTALEQVLRSCPAVELAFCDEGDVVRVTTQAQISSETFLRIYDVRALIDTMHAAYRNPETFKHLDNRGGLFTSANGGDENLTRAELVDTLVRLLEDSVFPESWKDNGGDIGSLRETAGLLFIVQSRRGHQAIARLLNQMQIELSKPLPTTKPVTP